MKERLLKMKIVVSGYIGKRITGIGRNLVGLLDSVSDENEYVVYTNSDMKDDLIFRNPQVTVKTYSISKMSSIKNLLWTTFVFPIVAKKEKADRVLIPNFTLLLFKVCPTVVIIHDLIEFNVKDKFSPIKMFYRTKIADPLMVIRSDKIITVSENSKRDIVKYLKSPEEKITVIYNGIEQDVFHRMEKGEAEKILKARGWPTDFILYVGTIDYPGKNSLAVIKSFEELKMMGKYNGHCVLAGMPGSGYKEIMNCINNSQFRQDIIVTGFVSDEELVALYSGCDVFVFISLYEGFGIPALEALACGARVVVSNTSSLPEVVGNLAMMTDPTDQSEISEAIYETMNKERDIDYMNNLKNHLEKFRWSELSKRFTDSLV